MKILASSCRQGTLLMCWHLSVSNSKFESMRHTSWYALSHLDRYKKADNSSLGVKQSKLTLWADHTSLPSPPHFASSQSLFYQSLHTLLLPAEMTFVLLIAKLLSITFLSITLATASAISRVDLLDKRAGTKVQAAYFTNWQASSAHIFEYTSFKRLKFLRGIYGANFRE